MLDTILGNHEKIDILCVGTPNVVGDAVGPLVGSMLSKHNINANIIGTIDNPVIALNYYKRIKEVRPDALLIVVDATLSHRINTFDILLGPMRPGAAVGGKVEPIGDISVRAYTGPTVREIVNADKWSVTMLAYSITTRLLDLLHSTKIKVYIE